MKVQPLATQLPLQHLLQVVQQLRFRLQQDLVTPFQVGIPRQVADHSWGLQVPVTHQVDPLLH